MGIGTEAIGLFEELLKKKQFNNCKSIIELGSQDVSEALADTEISTESDAQKNDELKEEDLGSPDVIDMLHDPEVDLESVEGANKYSGKNIRLSNDQKFFVTDDGYYKKYSNDEVYQATAGKNGCPQNFTSVEVESIDKLDRKLLKSDQ